MHYNFNPTIFSTLLGSQLFGWIQVIQVNVYSILKDKSRVSRRIQGRLHRLLSRCLALPWRQSLWLAENFKIIITRQTSGVSKSDVMLSSRAKESARPSTAPRRLLHEGLYCRVGPVSGWFGKPNTYKYGNKNPTMQYKCSSVVQITIRIPNESLTFYSRVVHILINHSTIY